MNRYGLLARGVSADTEQIRTTTPKLKKYRQTPAVWWKRKYGKH